MKKTFSENINSNIREFIKDFSEHVIKNLLLLIFFTMFRKYFKYMLSKEHYNSIKPLFKNRYIRFRAEEDFGEFILSKDEIQKYTIIINNIPSYERICLIKILELIYDGLFDFNYQENIDYDYDGFDVGRYVMYKPIFGKRKFIKVVKKGDEKFKFFISEDKEVNLLFINFLFYTPISNNNKRKILIKKIK